MVEELVLENFRGFRSLDLKGLKPVNLIVGHNSWANDGANAAEKRCIEGYVACMEAAGPPAHSPAKGLIGALLAVKSDEDPRLGPGARDNIFDLARPELEALRAFLSGVA